MASALTFADYQNAAESLGCSEAAIRAVASVESSGRGFTSTGAIVARFEAHLFKKATGIAATTYSQAFRINKTEANKASSWGMFQVLGSNFENAGYDDVESMIADYKKGEKRQLSSFVRLIKAWNLDDEIRDLQWATFARKYNGPNYAANNYDGKMAQAYAKYEPNPGQGLPKGRQTKNNVLWASVLVLLGVGFFFLYKRTVFFTNILTLFTNGTYQKI